MAGETFDRAAEDLGNITISSTSRAGPRPAARDAVLRRGPGRHSRPVPDGRLDNMWGQLRPLAVPPPTAKEQVLRGVTGLTIPDFDELGNRLSMAAEKLKGTKYSYRSRWITPTSPARGATACACTGRPALATMELGMPYVEAAGAGTRVTAGMGIRRVIVYREIMDAPATVTHNGCVAAEGQGGHLAEADLPRDGRSDRLVRRSSHRDLHQRLLGAAQADAGARDRQRGEQPVPVPLRRYRRSEERKVMFELEHEVPLHDAPDVPTAR